MEPQQTMAIKKKKKFEAQVKIFRLITKYRPDIPKNHPPNK